MTATVRVLAVDDRRENLLALQAILEGLPIEVVAVTNGEDALKQLLSEDVRFSMPPQSGVWQGRDEVVQSWIDGGFGTEPFGSMRCVVTRANRQPAVACYIRRSGDDAYTPMALDVLGIAGGAVADIVTFDGSVFGWFGLPAKL